MKNVYILISCMLILCNVSLVAQDKHTIKKFPQGVNREFEFQCPLNSVFSQGPLTAVAVVIQDQEVADDFLASGPIASIRFWGMTFDFITFTSCQTSVMTFNIKFYNKNLSDPSIPGDEFASYTLPTTLQLLEVVPGFWLFQADLNFPSLVPLTDGWVSITRIQDSDPCWAFLWGTDIGGNACENVAGEWVHAIDFWGMDYAPDFCLYTPAEAVPLTNWALVLGLILIGTFIIIRFRRS